MSEIVLFGIENCEQVRKARAWLRRGGIACRFHDFRAEGLDAALLATWLARVPWDSLINRRGLAWRKLAPEQRRAVTDRTSAAELMLSDPTLVKRPVLQAGDRIVVGFSEALYASVFDPAGDAGAAPRA